MAGPFLVTHPYEFCIKVLDTDTFLLVSVTFKCRLLFQDTYSPFPLSCLLGLFAPLSEMEFQECSLQEGPQNKLKFHGTLTQQLKTEDFLPLLWGSGVWGDEWWVGYREEVLNKQKLSLPLGRVSEEWFEDWCFDTELDLMNTKTKLNFIKSLTSGRLRFQKYHKTLCGKKENCILSHCEGFQWEKKKHR